MFGLICAYLALFRLIRADLFLSLRNQNQDSRTHIISDMFRHFSTFGSYFWAGRVLIAHLGMDLRSDRVLVSVLNPRAN